MEGIYPLDLADQLAIFTSREVDRIRSSASGPRKCGSSLSIVDETLMSSRVGSYTWLWLISIIICIRQKGRGEQRHARRESVRQRFASIAQSSLRSLLGKFWSPSVGSVEPTKPGGSIAVDPSEGSLFSLFLSLVTHKEMEYDQLNRLIS
jgi:hypothetical protein